MTNDDVSAIRSSAEIMVAPGDIVELRALGVRRPGGGAPCVVSGYFDDLDKMARAASSLARRAKGVYITMNPLEPALLARATNRVEEYPPATTADHDVVRRRWFALDIDPRRPAYVSSSDAEKAAALEVAETIERDLTDAGWPPPVWADSGNGYHLLYAIDLPNDDAARDLIKAALVALDVGYSTKAATVDITMFNAARIVKLYGTVASKGDNTPGRPHRRSGILSAPPDLGVVSRAQLEAVAALAPPTKTLTTPSSSTPRMGTPWDLESWLDEHGLTVHHVEARGGMDIYVLDVCPFDPGHGRDSRIIRGSSGALAFKCFHNGCSTLRWQDLRAKYEPGYLERREHATRPRRPAAPMPGRVATRNGDRPWSCIAEGVESLQLQCAPSCAPMADEPYDGPDPLGVLLVPPVDPPGAPLIDPRDKLAICQRFRETFGHMVYRYRHGIYRYNHETGLYDELAEEECKAFVLEWLYEFDEEKRVKGETLLAPFMPDTGFVEKFTKRGGLLWAYIVDLDPEEYRYAAWLPGMRPRDATDDLLPVRNYIIDLGRLASGPGAPPAYRYDGRVFARRKADIDYRPPDPGDPGPETWLRMLETSMSMRTIPNGPDGRPIGYSKPWEVARNYVVHSDEDTISVFQMMCGYLLTRESRWHHILYLVGAPRSGKSTILHVLDMIFPPGSIEATNSERFGGRFGLDNLYDARVIQFNEERGNEDVRSMKRLVGQLLAVSGQDRTNYEDKGVRSESTHIPGKIILTSNEEITLVDASGALVERLYIFPFRHNFQRLGAADPYLEDKLRAEASGILNWFLDGLGLFRSWGGYPARSPAMAEMHAAYARSSNTIEQWIGECAAIGDGERCSSEEMYHSWREWCAENGHHPGSKRTFLSHFKSATYHEPLAMKSLRIAGRTVYGCVGMSITKMY